jgi:hypothetical protein
MSTVLDAVGSVLQAAGVGTLATNIFLSRMPDTPEANVTVYETGAGYPIYTQGTTGPALMVTNIQIIARAGREDYQAARNKISAAMTAMEAINETTAASVRLLRAEQVSTIVPLGFDDNERQRISVTFAVTHG